MKILKDIKLSRFIAIGAAFTLLGTGIGYAAGEWENIWVQFDSVNLKVNGQNVTSSNLLYNDRTYVPLRACAEMLGSTVGWDQNTNTASILTNTAGSADTAKIKKIQAAARIMDNFESMLVLSSNLDVCYIDCVTFSNSVKFDVDNFEDVYDQRIQFLNELIEQYNDFLQYIDIIEDDMLFIGMDNSKVREMMEYYGNCIDCIVLAYQKFILSYNTQNSNEREQGLSLAHKGNDYIEAGDVIRISYFNEAFEYSQK